MVTPCRLCGQRAHPGRCAMWCHDCGALLAYDAARYAYVHVEPGADHAPRPTTKRPEVPA